MGSLFFAPRAVMVYNGKTHWSPPGVPSPGGEDEWLWLWADVLSGNFFKRFDDPAVEVRQEGSMVSYHLSDGELAVDARTRCLSSARVTTGGKTVFLKFSEPREEGGLILPSVVEGVSREEGTGFVLRFSRMAINPVLKPTLFVPDP
jgi:hypothetical protein